MAQSLYDILGVDPNADTDTITKAYRRKAQKVHPDKEDGDTEEFQKLVAAYEVLVDEHKRKQYDENGTVENNDEHSHLRELVAVLFHLVDRVQDVRYTNLITESKRVVNKGIEKGKQQIEDLKDRREVIARLSRKGGDNPLAAALENDIQKRENGIASITASLTVGDELLRMLDEYTYRVDEPPKDIHMVSTSFIRTGGFFTSARGG